MDDLTKYITRHIVEEDEHPPLTETDRTKGLNVLGSFERDIKSLRRKFDNSTEYFDTPMTLEEIAGVDSAFDHLEEAFDNLGAAYELATEVVEKRA